MVELLMQVREGLAAGSIADDDGVLNALGALGSAKGAGTVSAAAAIYLTARYAAQPVQGVLRGAFAVGADTDTIAAMTGALLGVLAGTDWLPREWFSVQDCDYLRQIANKLVVRDVLNEGATSRSIGNKDVDVLLEALISGSRDDLDFGGVRRVRVVGSRAPVSVSRSATVQTWQLQASDGQTIHLAKVSRKTKDDGIATEDKGRDIAPQAVLPWHSQALDDHAVHVTKASRKTKDDAIASEGRAHDIPPKATPPREERKPEARAAGVKLTVANLAASVGFYEGVLGLSPSKRTPKFVSFGPLSLIDGPYAVGLSGGAVTLEKSAGRNRVEIYVSDIDAIHVRLLEHRVRLVQPITVMPWGERSLHCLDPDGNVVELVERRAR
jgi:ADP-ribosylglycohydrolase